MSRGIAFPEPEAVTQVFPPKKGGVLIRLTTSHHFGVKLSANDSN